MDLAAGLAPFQKIGVGGYGLAIRLDFLDVVALRLVGFRLVEPDEVEERIVARGLVQEGERFRGASQGQFNARQT